MATIRKVGQSWRAEVRFRGQYASANFATKARAKRWATQLEADIVDKGAGVLRGKGKIVADAFDEYSLRVSPFKKSYVWECKALERFKRFEFSGLLLTKVSPSDLSEWKSQRLTEARPATVLREINLISNVFRYCVEEWLWMEENPCKKLQRPKAPPTRGCRISARESKAILRELDFLEGGGRQK